MARNHVLRLHVTGIDEISAHIRKTILMHEYLKQLTYIMLRKQTCQQMKHDVT